MSRDDEKKQIESVVERLSERFADSPRTRIERIVDELTDKYEDSKVRDYVPVLIEREAKQKLRSAA